VYDLPTFFGEGRAWRLVPNHFGGYPWDNAAPELPLADEAEVPPADSVRSIREILYANSPLTFVDQIQTPLLIIHGDADRRTGYIQSEVLYKSLKVLEKPVELVRYPGAEHDLSRSGDPLQRIDRILRIHEFVARYVE
jgi:dipeptidyl aminopeptidase/acylaminoacyl peptidase